MRSINVFKENWSLFLMNDLFGDIITFLNFIIVLVIYIYASNIKLNARNESLKLKIVLLSKNCKFKFKKQIKFAEIDSQFKCEKSFFARKLALLYKTYTIAYRLTIDKQNLLSIEYKSKYLRNDEEILENMINIRVVSLKRAFIRIESQIESQNYYFIQFREFRYSLCQMNLVLTFDFSNTLLQTLE
jgi:hypothetical protein